MEQSRGRRRKDELLHDLIFPTLGFLAGFMTRCDSGGRTGEIRTGGTHRPGFAQPTLLIAMFSGRPIKRRRPA